MSQIKIILAFNLGQFYVLFAGRPVYKCGPLHIVKNSIGVKYKQWSHEDEYRLIANSNSKGSGLLSLPHYAPFLKFTGVIIGAKMEQKYIKKIQDLQKIFGFSIKKACLSDNAYELEVK